MNQKEQIDYIIKHAFDTPLKRIAKIIGRSSCFVVNEMKRQNINVPQEIRDGFASQSRYKAGCVPMNKGVPQREWMPEESIAKTKQTRFVKNRLPHNTKHDFAISIRESKGVCYMWIRVKKAKWRLYHRWLWEQIYGEIKKGFNVQFKDKNALNCEIENLYLVNRKDQIVINKKGGNKIPYELQQTIIIINRLKNKINEKQDR